MARQLQKKFIGNDQVDSTKILLEQGQAIRVKDSNGVEQELIKLGASDEVVVSGQEVATKAQLDAEVAGFNNALGVTNAAIAQEVLDRQSAVTGLEDAIDQEITDRQDADALKADLAGATFTGDVFVPTLRPSGSANIGYFGEEFNTISVKTIQSSDSADMQINSTGSKVVISAGNDYGRNGSGVAKDIMLNPTSGQVDATYSRIKNVGTATEYNDAVIKGQLDSVETNLQGQIDALSGSSGSSIASVQAELDATQVGVGLNPDGSFSAPVGGIYTSGSTSVKDALGDLDAALNTEVLAREQAITATESLITAEETARTQADSNLQSQIDAIMQGSSSSLDSFIEVVNAFQAADASLNGAITALSTGLSQDISDEASARASADVVLQNNIDAEESARIAGDSALDARLDVLEAVVWVKQKFTITNGQTSVTLSFTPKANSMSAFVDRLAIHEGASEDYTISGTTMTFLNDLVSPGQSQLGNGDTVYVKYQK